MEEWTEVMLREKLSARQYQVLTLVARRFSSKEIGRQLGLSYKTVDNHVADILDKLELSTRADAARAFLEAQQGRERLPKVVERLDEPAFPPPIPVQPAAFAAPEFSLEPYPTRAWDLLKEMLKLPPVGGRRHNLTAAQRLMTMSLIGLVAVVSMLAVVMVIVGVLTLLGR